MKDKIYLLLTLAISITSLSGYLMNQKEIIAEKKFAVYEKIDRPVFVNLNTADMSDLISLPGIGEKTARDIIERRDEIGSFKRIEDVMQIKGIKEKKFNGIKKFIYIDDTCR